MSQRERSIVVLVGTTDDETRDEALRAAVGLTLRGGRVRVVVTDPTATFGPDARRARATLEMMGHVVEDRAVANDLSRADVVEVWGVVGPAVDAVHTDDGTAHLVRPGRPAPAAMPGAAVLHLPPVLDRDDADRLLDQLLAADRVVVW